MCTHPKCNVEKHEQRGHAAHDGNIFKAFPHNDLRLLRL